MDKRFSYRSSLTAGGDVRKEVKEQEEAVRKLRAKSKTLKQEVLKLREENAKGLERDLQRIQERISASRWKERGDEAVKNGDLKQALSCYTK